MNGRMKKTKKNFQSKKRKSKEHTMACLRWYSVWHRRLRCCEWYSEASCSVRSHSRRPRQATPDCATATHRHRRCRRPHRPNRGSSHCPGCRRSCRLSCRCPPCSGCRRGRMAVSRMTVHVNGVDSRMDESWDSQASRSDSMPIGCWSYSLARANSTTHRSDSDCRDRTTELQECTVDSDSDSSACNRECWASSWDSWASS